MCLCFCFYKIMFWTYLQVLCNSCSSRNCYISESSSNHLKMSGAGFDFSSSFFSFFFLIFLIFHVMNIRFRFLVAWPVLELNYSFHFYSISNFSFFSSIVFLCFFLWFFVCLWTYLTYNTFLDAFPLFF